MTTMHREPQADDVAGIASLTTSATAFAQASAALVGNVLGHVARLVGDVTEDATVVAREAQDLWHASRRRAADLGGVIRAAPRFTRITGELLRVIASYRWHAAVYKPGVADDAVAAAALAGLHQRNAERLYRVCVELRGGVLKIGQFVSSRMDLLPDEYVAALSRLQDRVPPLPTEAIAERVFAELVPLLTDTASPFESFDSEPLAAASLAQVHAACLADGTRVVVKVQVPGIDEVVETDLAALRAVAPALRDLLPFADLDTVVATLAVSVRSELDYAAEARNAAAFAACFDGDMDLIVPRVHAGLSTRRVLVLDRIDGERLVDYLEGCGQRGAAGAADCDQLFTILVRSFCAQVLQHGLLHADPHPGNFLVVTGAAGPRLAVLDFGSVQTYSATRRRAYAELALAILASDSDRMGVQFHAMGFRSRDASSAGLRAFADLLLEAFRTDARLDTQQLDTDLALARILQLTRDNPIVAVPSDFVLLGRVFAVLGGLITRYRPRINLFQIIMPQLLAALQAETGEDSAAGGDTTPESPGG